MIYTIQERATPEQLRQMLLTLGIYIKIAVDIQREILVGGGELHADCERVLLKNGSQQSTIWGADWYPAKQTIGYESIINIRPNDHNRSMIVQNLEIRSQMHQIIHSLLGGVQWQ
jgi:hypothetical protein